MGTRFKCRYCPRKYKTRSNRKKHEDKSCTSSRSPAGAARRDYTPALAPNTSQSGPRSPKPEDKEGFVKDMSIGDSDGEDLAACLTGETDRGAQRPHAPRAPSPNREREIVTVILQEPFEQGLEYLLRQTSLQSLAPCNRQTG